MRRTLLCNLSVRIGYDSVMMRRYQEPFATRNTRLNNVGERMSSGDYPDQLLNVMYGAAIRDLLWSDVPAGIAKLRVVRVGSGAT
jgi:hypothetical protein